MTTRFFVKCVQTSEPWLKNWAWPEGQTAFNLFVFLLGLLFIALSWFGYHKSIKNKPLEGKLRFVLDVVLVLFYLLLLFKYQNFHAVLSLLVIIYSLFILWDALKIIEHPEKYDKNEKFFSRYARELITLQWFIIFSLLLVIYYLYGGSVVILIAAFVGTILYRIDKDHYLIGSMLSGIKKWAVGSSKNA